MKKRFIAGASCPSCSEQDTLRWWIENNIEWVECVECEFLEQREPKAIEEKNNVPKQAATNMIGIFKPE